MRAFIASHIVQR